MSIDAPLMSSLLQQHYWKDNFLLKPFKINCVDWCKMQVNGTQRRLMVHSIALCAGQWCTTEFPKPTQTHTQTGPILLPRPLM